MEANAKLTSELRVYMAGLSDESGAAQPLAMAVGVCCKVSLNMPRTHSTGLCQC